MTTSRIGLGGRWQWNPLSAHWLDSYSLAYTIASLINQLFGRGQEPFWQQAYTNLVRWLIELHRMTPDGWVTLRDVYRCTLEPDRIEQLIEEVAASVEPTQTARIAGGAMVAHAEALEDWEWQSVEGSFNTTDSAELRTTLDGLGITYKIDVPPAVDPERRERLDAIRRWFRSDWSQLDKKIRSTVVEGLSVFLSVFDLPEVAAVFCPAPPPPRPARAEAAAGNEGGSPRRGSA